MHVTHVSPTRLGIFGINKHAVISVFLFFVGLRWRRLTRSRVLRRLITTETPDSLNNSFNNIKHEQEAYP